MSESLKINNAVKMIANLSVDAASRVLSKMIKTGASIELERAYVADISEVTSSVSATEEDEVIGAYIDIIGDAPFKFLFFVSAQDSMVITDLVLQRAVGTTQELDLYTHSAVQELGNVLASAVTNVFSRDLQVQMRPSPPVVVYDYAGTVFEEYIMQSIQERNEIFVMESRFVVINQNLKCYMFIVPEDGSEEVLNHILNAE